MAEDRTLSMMQGALGGLVAGAVVVVWFFVLDVAAGSALRTPAALGGALLGGGGEVPAVRLAAAYTLLHFGVFAGVGIAVASFLRLAGIAPGVLIGGVVGLGVLDAIHYGALLTTGSTVLTVLPPGQVIAANLAAGIALAAYLHYAARSGSPFGLGLLREHVLIASGVGTGLVGAAAVAIWFMVVDVLAGTPFFTPAALGSAVFLSAASPAEVQVTLGIVAAYTALHLAAFAVAGTAMVLVAEQLERAPGMWLMAFMAFMVLEGVFIGAGASFAEWVLGTFAWWTVGIGNVAAVAAMGGWIWRTHPVLRRQLVEAAPQPQL